MNSFRFVMLLYENGLKSVLLWQHSITSDHQHKLFPVAVQTCFGESPQKNKSIATSLRLL